MQTLDRDTGHQRDLPESDVDLDHDIAVQHVQRLLYGTEGKTGWKCEFQLHAENSTSCIRVGREDGRVRHSHKLHIHTNKLLS